MWRVEFASGSPRIADQVWLRRAVKASANEGVRLVVYQGRSGQVGSSAWTARYQCHTVVPGHGDVVDQSFVRGQVEELTAMADLCRLVQHSELDVEAALARAPFPERYARDALKRSAAPR